MNATHHGREGDTGLKSSAELYQVTGRQSVKMRTCLTLLACTLVLVSAKGPGGKGGDRMISSISKISTNRFFQPNVMTVASQPVPMDLPQSR